MAISFSTGLKDNLLDTGSLKNQFDDGYMRLSAALLCLSLTVTTTKVSALVRGWTLIRQP